MPHDILYLNINLEKKDGMEIIKITEYLDDGEEILAVATQSRWYPGGSPITPNTIFATDKKIIIRNPMLLGLREHVDYYHYKDIITIKHRKGHFTSALQITAPGMGSSARSEDNEDGMINAIDTAKALEIQKIVKERTSK